MLFSVIFYTFYRYYGTEAQTFFLQVRIEAALTLRALAKVDPSCVGGLISYGVTTLHALRESGSLEKVMLVSEFGVFSYILILHLLFPNVSYSSVYANN